MRTLLLATATVALLAGCASTAPTVEVVPQREYVVRTAPDSLKTLPPLPTPLANPRTASSSEIASWISRTEEYVANLEGMLSTLVDFYEKPVTTTEAGTMRPVTPVVTPSGGRVLQPQVGTRGANTLSITAAQPASSSPSTFSTPIQRAAGQ